MSIESHTQLPNQVLKHFRDSDGKVWYLDLQKGIIGKRATKKLGVVTDYYSVEMEQYLSSTVEGPLGSFWEKLKDFAAGRTDSVTINTSEEKAVKDYLLALVARSNFMIQKFERESLTSELCTPQTNHDDLVWFILSHRDDIAHYIDQLQVAYLSNNTEKCFIVPKNGYYCIYSKSREHIIIPMSPRFAFILKSEEDVDVDETDEKIHHYHIDNKDDIYDFNLMALQFEYAFNKEFVAGARKEELTELIPFLGKHKDKLEKQRNKFVK